jgi:ubiquinone/menaquinone biosynthesis C-methylase UbiE
MRQGLDRPTLKALYDRVARRYDLQHALSTARSDERGREFLVEQTVRPGNTVLDCGAGTGSTALLAARRVGAGGRLVLLDLSPGMLAVARSKVATAGLQRQITLVLGDMTALPLADGSFDVVLSTYSMCPLGEPVQGALELYRVARPGGRIGIAHSSHPETAFARWLAGKVESAVWRFPSLSLGCRSVSVLPALERAGARVLFRRAIGVPLWPFCAFVAVKPPI